MPKSVVNMAFAVIFGTIAAEFIVNKTPVKSLVS